VARKEKEKHFLFSTQEIEAKTQNHGPQVLVLYWRAGELLMVRDNWSGWLIWLTKQGGVPFPNHTQSHPHPTQNTEKTGVLSNFPFIALCLSKDPGSLLTSQKGKQKQVAPLCLPVPVTLATKDGWG
jgi:hypothetical protein